MGSKERAGSAPCRPPRSRSGADSGCTPTVHPGAGGTSGGFRPRLERRHHSDGWGLTSAARRCWSSEERRRQVARSYGAFGPGACSRAARPAGDRGPGSLRRVAAPRASGRGAQAWADRVVRKAPRRPMVSRRTGVGERGGGRRRGDRLVAQPPDGPRRGREWLEARLRAGDALCGPRRPTSSPPATSPAADAWSPMRSRTASCRHNAVSPRRRWRGKRPPDRELTDTEYKGGAPRQARSTQTSSSPSLASTKPADDHQGRRRFSADVDRRRPVCSTRASGRSRSSSSWRSHGRTDAVDDLRGADLLPTYAGILGSAARRRRQPISNRLAAESNDAVYRSGDVPPRTTPGHSNDGGAVCQSTGIRRRVPRPRTTAITPWRAPDERSVEREARGIDGRRRLEVLSEPVRGLHPDRPARRPADHGQVQPVHPQHPGPPRGPQPRTPADRGLGDRAHRADRAAAGRDPRRGAARHGAGRVRDGAPVLGERPGDVPRHPGDAVEPGWRGQRPLLRGSAVCRAREARRPHQPAGEVRDGRGRRPADGA